MCVKAKLAFLIMLLTVLAMFIVLLLLLLLLLLLTLPINVSLVLMKKRLFFAVRHTIELSICAVVIRGFAILFVFVYIFVVFVAFVVYLREPLQSNIPNLQTSLSSTIELKR